MNCVYNGKLNKEVYNNTVKLAKINLLLTRKKKINLRQISMLKSIISKHFCKDHEIFKDRAHYICDDRD